MSKVTIEQVNASIKGETYTVLPDGRTTICQLTLDNGFTVSGHSACANKENFNKEDGEKYSREAAVSQIWQFLAFRMLDGQMAHKLSTKPNFRDRLSQEREDLHDRVVKLREFLNALPAYVGLNPEISPVQKKALQEQYGHMKNYLLVLDQRIQHLVFTEKFQGAI